MNCHYVTRWITEEWEQEPGSLLYYDFADRQVKRQFSKRLFAEEDTNTGEIEGLLNKYVETPLKQLKPKLLEAKDLQITDWSQYRSLFLYFMIQAARYSKAKLSPEEQKAEEHHLDQMLKKGEDFLNQLVQADMQKNQIVAATMPTGQILFFPEVGFFQIPVKDPGCITDFTFGFVVPITPFIAIARVSKTADIRHLLENRAQLSGFSVGLNDKMQRILIPKLIREQHNDDAISKVMDTQREAAINIVTGTHQIRQLVVEMYRKAGLEVGPIKPDQTN